MKKTVLIFVFSLVFFFSYYLFKQNTIKVKNDNLKQESITESIIQEDKVETLEEIAFRTGYARGRRNMLIQMGVKEEEAEETEEESEEEDKFVSYTSNLEATEEDREKFKEIYMKAYVDGYHRAGDSVHCPRYH